jgi:flagellar biosynthetic protein FliO
MRIPVANTIRLSISATTVLLAAGQVSAEEVFTDAQWNQASPVIPRAQPTGEIVGKSLVSIGLSLAFVLALAVFLGWLVKRLGVKRLVQAKGRHLNVVDSVSLGFKRQASLVRLGNQVVLIGLGEHELTHLATFPASILEQDEAVAPPKAEGDSKPTAAVPPPAAEVQDPAFRNLLASVLKR